MVKDDENPALGVTMGRVENDLKKVGIIGGTVALAALGASYLGLFDRKGDAGKYKDTAPVVRNEKPPRQRNPKYVNVAEAVSYTHLRAHET